METHLDRTAAGGMRYSAAPVAPMQRTATARFRSFQDTEMFTRSESVLRSRVTCSVNSHNVAKTRVIAHTSNMRYESKITSKLDFIMRVDIGHVGVCERLNG